MRHTDPNKRWREIARRHARARRLIKAAFALACAASIAFGALAIADARNRTVFTWLTAVALLATAGTGAAWRGARDFEREFGHRFRE